MNTSNTFTTNIQTIYTNFSGRYIRKSTPLATFYDAIGQDSKLGGDKGLKSLSLSNASHLVKQREIAYIAEDFNDALDSINIPPVDPNEFQEVLKYLTSSSIHQYELESFLDKIKRGDDFVGVFIYTSKLFPFEFNSGLLIIYADSDYDIPNLIYTAVGIKSVLRIGIFTGCVRDKPNYQDNYNTIYTILAVFFLLEETEDTPYDLIDEFFLLEDLEYIDEEKPFETPLKNTEPYVPKYKALDPVPTHTPSVSNDSDFERAAGVVDQIMDYVLEWVPELKTEHFIAVGMFTSLLVAAVLAYSIKKARNVLIAVVTSLVIGIFGILLLSDDFFGSMKFDKDFIKKCVRYVYDPEIPDDKKNFTDVSYSAVEDAAVALKIRGEDVSKENLTREITSIQTQSSNLIMDAIDLILIPLTAIILSVTCNTQNFAQKFMKQIFSTVNGFKSSKKTLVELKESLLEFFFPEKSYGHILISQREENLKCIQPPIAILLSSSDHYQRLISCAVNSKRLSKSILDNNGTNEVYKHFMHSFSLVESKIAECSKILELGGIKQTPTAVWMYGVRAIGKTTLINSRICKDLAARLGVKPTVFDVKPDNNGYYKEYAGQFFAFMDEVASRADSSSEFSGLNQLISSASSNIPSAFVKEQPFMSKFLFLASNYELSVVDSRSGLIGASSEALRSRFIEIEIQNPKVDLTKARGFDPSWFDISNYIFILTTELPSSGLSRSQKKTRKISYDELLDILIDDYKKNEKAYLNACEEIIPKTQSFVDNKTPIINFYGPQDTGKTTQAKQFISFYSKAHSKNFKEIKNLSEIELIKAGDHLFLNDIINIETMNNPLIFKLENLGKTGMVVSTTNIQPKLVSWFQIFTSLKLFQMFLLEFVKTEHLPVFDHNDSLLFKIFKILIHPHFQKPYVYQQMFDEEGFYRRLGFSGVFFHKRTLLDVSSGSIINIQAKPFWNYEVNRKITTAGNVLRSICAALDNEKIHTCVVSDIDYQLERETLQWNVLIDFDSADLCYQYFRTFSPMAVTPNVSENSIAFRDSQIFRNSSMDVTVFKSFIQNIHNIEEQAVAVLTYVASRFPEIKILTRIGDKFIKLDNGLITKNFEYVPMNIEEFYVDGTLMISYEQQSYEAKKFLQYVSTKTSYALTNQEMLVFEQLSQARTWPPNVLAEFNRLEMEKLNARQLTDFEIFLADVKVRCTNSLLFKLVLGLLAVISISYAGIKMFSSVSKEEEPIKNQRMKKQRGALKTRSGKRYYVTTAGAVYSGDEDFQEGRYEDLLDRDEEFDYYDLPEYQKIDTQVNRVVLLDPDYFDRVLLEKENNESYGIVIPRGGQYMMQNVNIRKKNSNDNFSFKCVAAYDFPNIESINTFNQDFPSLSLTYKQLCHQVLEHGGVTIIYSRAKRILPKIALPSKVINNILSGKTTTFSTTLQGKCNTSNIIELETNKKFSISFTETKEKLVDEDRVVSKQYPKRFFKVNTYSLPETQQISSLMRKTSQCDLLMDKIKRNAVQIISPRGAVGGFLVHNSWILTVKHCVRGIDVDDISILEEGSNKPIKVFETIEHPQRDLALIRTNFSSKSLLSSLSHNSMEFQETILAALGGEPSIATSTKIMAYDATTDLGECLKKDVCFRGSFNVKAPLTQNGDCGRPYLSISENPKIFGMHVAGSKISCYGTLLDVEWITEIVSLSSQQISRYDIPEFSGFLEVEELIPYIKSPDKPYSTPCILGEYLHEVVPNLKRPVKTSIAECTENELLLIPKNALGEHDFYLGQILQYNDVIKPFHDEICNRFVHGFVSAYGASIQNHHGLDVLTLEEALCGINNPNDSLFTYTSSLNWQSAIGYEMRNMFKVNKMEDIFDPISKTFKETTAAHYFKTRVESGYLKAFHGKRFREILQDNLKQENRENEKAYKQRVFTSFPKTLSVLIRSFTLRFAGWMIKHEEFLPYKIAMNTAAEFDTMRRDAEVFDAHLRSFGFDVSRCDKHIRKQFFQDVLGKIFKKLIVISHSNSNCNCNHTLEQHLNAIDVVILHLYDNYVASQDCIYHKTTGSSSGSDLTIIINVLYLDWCCFAWFCYIASTTKRFPPTFEAYRKLVFPFFCGDDGKITVNHNFADVLNFKTLKEFLAGRGINIDTPNKDGEEYETLHFDEIPFVSRMWVQHVDGTYYHKFKKEVISGLIYWTVDTSTTQIDLALELLSEYIAPHGEELYDKFYAGVIKYQQENYSSFSVPSYSEALFKTLRHIRGMAFVQLKIDQENPDQNSYIKTQMEMSSVNENTSDVVGEKKVKYRSLNKKYKKYIQRIMDRLTQALVNIEIGDLMSDNSYPVADYDKLMAYLSLCKAIKRRNVFPFKPMPCPSPSWVEEMCPHPIYYWIYDIIYDAMNHFPFPDSFMSLANDYVLLKLFPTIKAKLSWMKDEEEVFETPNESVEDIRTQMMRNANPMQKNNTGAFIDPEPDAQQSGFQSFVQGNSNPVPEQSSLATVDVPTMPAMENMFVSSTIPYGNPLQTRLDYLPDSLLAAGGVTEDLKDLAYGSYQVVEVIQVPVSTQQDRLVYTVSYGLDLLGGYAGIWAKLHKRFTGPIAVKFTFISNSVIQGSMRVYWNLPGKPRNIANSSPYGARDVDLSAPRQEINMMLQPISGPDGKFFFTTGEPNADQAEINIITLTDIGNSFSGLGNIQIVVESRILPTMRFADPYGTDEVAPVDQSLEQALVLSEVDLSDSTIFIETKRYPKFPDLPADVTNFMTPLNTDITRLKDFSPTTTTVDFGVIQNSKCRLSNDTIVDDLRTEAGTYNTNTYTAVVGDDSISYDCSTTIVGGKVLRTVQGISAQQDLTFYTLNEKETQTASVSSLNKVSRIGNRLVSSLDYNLMFRYNGNVTTAYYHPTRPLLVYPKALNASEVGNITIDSSLDTLTLPQNFYTIEIGAISLSDPIMETAPDLNSAVRSQAGWVIYNYCRENCPDGGQVKISIVDPTFKTTIVEFLYRRDIGFFTNATAAQINTFFNGTLNNFQVRTQIYKDKATVQLNNDFSSFISRVATETKKVPRIRTEAAIIGGIFGGIGSGLTQWGQWNHENEMQQADINNSRYLATLNNQNSIMLRQMMGEQTLEQMNTRWNQQNMYDNINRTAKNVKGASQGAMFQPARAPTNRRNNKMASLRPDQDPLGVSDQRAKQQYNDRRNMNNRNFQNMDTFDFGENKQQQYAQGKNIPHTNAITSNSPMMDQSTISETRSVNGSDQRPISWSQATTLNNLGGAPNMKSNNQQKGLELGQFTNCLGVDPTRESTC